MFILNTRFQIAALCFFVVIVFDYNKKQKIAAIINKAFFGNDSFCWVKSLL